MCTKLSSWSISSTRLPEPVASGANADSGFGGSPRLEQRRRLDLAFPVFGGRIGIEQAGRPYPHLSKTILHPDGADGQTGIDAAVEIHGADRAGVPAPRRTLIVLDELHRP